MRRMDPLRSYRYIGGEAHVEQVVVMRPEPQAMSGETDSIDVEDLLMDELAGSEMTLKRIGPDMMVVYLTEDSESYLDLRINHLGTLIISRILGQLTEVRGPIVFGHFTFGELPVVHPLSPSSQGWVNAQVMIAQDIMQRTGLDLELRA